MLQTIYPQWKITFNKNTGLTISSVDQSEGKRSNDTAPTHIV